MKEDKLLQLRLGAQKNKLAIQMNKEYQILLKKTKLHEHEIKRIQGQASKAAWKKGKYEGELQRTKKKTRETNKIIKATK